MELQLSEKLKEMKSLLDENIALETHLQLQTRKIKLQLDEILRLTDKLVEAGRIRRIKAYLNCVQVVVRQKLKKSSFSSNRAMTELVRMADSLEERVTENTRFIQKVKELSEVVENLKVDIRELLMQRIENYTD
ncbi:uncharacterized protein LOC143902256 isoform X2 [Temnothorax americanus]|uniref:uncharacterized protein LOC143902256 isoform X2 n=1 Tax=Temnothorax americanus TaxID=1964332 RepID=UPI004069717F